MGRGVIEEEEEESHTSNTQSRASSFSVSRQASQDRFEAKNLNVLQKWRP